MMPSQAERGNIRRQTVSEKPPRVHETPLETAPPGVIDPTKNVLDALSSAVTRLDDLRHAETRRVNEIIAAETRRTSELLIAHEKLDSERHAHEATSAALRASYEDRLSLAESRRIDAIRAVDREDVAKTAAAAQVAITTLANTTNTMADTLRNQVATVAGAAENRQTAYAAEVNKRLSALELSSSEGKGKEAVADPAMERMARQMEQFIGQQAERRGQSQGVSMAWVVLLGAVGLLSTIIAIGGAIYTFTRPSPTPAVIYQPAPAPAQVPR